MALLSWPAELPQRMLVDAYNRTGRDGVEATDMKAGPPKTRLRTSSAVEPLQGAVEVRTAGLARFRRFYNEELKFGSKLFWIRDQAFDGQPLTTGDGSILTNADGEPLLQSAHWLVMFTPGSPPRETNLRGDEWRISFNLIILP
ncbi:hypothetical protein [Hansschlegelia sp.]|uniref:hypothetical protein n=1 Tax=Hansschlegelia sp. TaxID=2041892 RepID=UPI002CA9E6C7|nr:hypothetical protein [Hansschlegelia sp.]HVI28866.1 hypothetical protein [Hansschlegelia sp.]